MSAENNQQERAAFLSSVPLLHAFLDPRRTSGNDKEKAFVETHLLFETQRVERTLNKVWLKAAIAANTAMIEGSLEAQFGAHTILHMPEQQLFDFTKIMFLVGWQGGPRTQAFVPDIVARLKDFQQLDIAVPLHDRQEEAFSFLVSGALMAGANAKADHTYHVDLPSDINQFLRRTERRLDPSDELDEDAS